MGYIYIYMTIYEYKSLVLIFLFINQCMYLILQALQATIEKSKQDYEQLKKRAKMSDSRLQQLLKDQNDIISSKLMCQSLDFDCLFIDVHNNF